MRPGFEHPDTTTDSVRADLPFLLVIGFLLLIMLSSMDEETNNSLKVQAEWDFSLPGKSPASRLDTYRKQVLSEANVPVRAGHSRADVDLYVARLAPVKECVWFASESSASLQLDNDDLGWAGNDPGDDRNVEIASSPRSQLPSGFYAINLHLFDRAAEQVPISVFVDVVINEGRGDEVRVSKEVELTRQGQEVNVLTFEIGEDGGVTPGSVKKSQQTIRLLDSNGQCGGAP